MTFVRYDSKLLEVERQEQLGDWGFTAVRLGSMWSGVEPVEGQVGPPTSSVQAETSTADIYRLTRPTLTS